MVDDKNNTTVNNNPQEIDTNETTPNTSSGNSGYNPYTAVREVKKVTNVYNSWIKNPKVIAETVLRKPSITCSITMPVQHNNNGQKECITTTIPFYMSSDFSLNLQSHYESLVNDDSLFGLLPDIVKLIENPAAQALGDSTQVRLQSRAMSAQSWKESKMGDLSVDCLFVCTRREVNPAYIIRMLSACCLPRRLTTEDKFPSSERISAVKDIFDIGVNVIGAGLKTVAESKGVQNVLNVVGSGISKIGNSVANGTKQLVNNQNKSNILTDLANNYKSYSSTNTDVNGLKNLTSKLNTTGGDFLSNIGEVAGNLISSVVDNGVSMLKAFAGGVGYVAPLEYGLIMERDSEGNFNGEIVPIPNTTVTLQIGDWFRADELVVTGISGITFSKELVAPYTGLNGKKSTDLYDNTPTLKDDGGYPLYAKCTLSLRPIVRMDYSKFQSYFIKENWNDYYKDREAKATNNVYQTLENTTSSSNRFVSTWDKIKSSSIVQNLNNGGN